jgi:PAS domain S-box-containing protein
MPVKAPLRILYLEDDPNDAELVQAMLEGEDVACQVTLVDTRIDFLASLERDDIDLILADYSLPSFDGISALRIAVEKRPEVPFIFVSGTMGEEVAIEALKIGATDYVLKTRLSRILPSVQRALREGRDRAERTRAEEALRRSEAYLAEAQRLSRTGSTGWDVASGEIYWSEETYRIFEYDRTVKPTVELILQRVHPDDSAVVNETIERASREGKDYEYKYRLLMPDGSIKHVHVVAHATINQSGGVEFVGAVMDETAAKQAEEALRISEEQWRDVFENNPIMYFMVDEAGKVMAVNPFGADQLGYRVDELVGQPVLSVFYGSDREAVQNSLAACLEQLGRGTSWEFRSVRKNGTVLRVRGSAKAVARVNGPILLIACEDITEQRRAEEALFHAGLEARVSERVRIAREMHDTLLQSFHGLMLRFQVARDMLPARPEEAMQSLDGALAMADQAITESRDAIQDLRSKPIGPIDLEHLLTALGQELADSRDENDDATTFSVTVEGERRTLSPSLQDEVYRVGREVLRNAFRHAGARHIDAEIRYDERLLRLRIRDDGKGIEPKVLEKGGRAGHWGLIGIRERAKRMGAQLHFWSEAGVGTEVQLTVPASVAYEISRAGNEFKPIPQDDESGIVRGR